MTLRLRSGAAGALALALAGALLSIPNVAVATEGCTPLGDSGVCHEGRTRLGMWLQSTRWVDIWANGQVIEVPAGERKFLPLRCELDEEGIQITTLPATATTGDGNFDLPRCTSSLEETSAARIASVEPAWVTSHSRGVPTRWFDTDAGRNKILEDEVVELAGDTKTVAGVDVETRRPDGSLYSVEHLERRDSTSFKGAFVWDYVKCSGELPCLGNWTTTAIGYDANGRVRATRTIVVAGRLYSSVSPPRLVKFERLGRKIHRVSQRPKAHTAWLKNVRFRATFKDPDRSVLGDVGLVSAKGLWRGAKSTGSWTSDSIRYTDEGTTVITASPAIAATRYGCHRVYVGSLVAAPDWMPDPDVRVRGTKSMRSTVCFRSR